MPGAIGTRSARPIQVGGLVVALIAAVYLLALQLAPEGECGRDSPFWFGAVVSQTFVDYTEFGAGGGSATPEEAASEYADQILGRSDYQLIPESDMVYMIYSDDDQLLGRITVFDTGFDRYVAGGHSTCYQRFEDFARGPA